MRFLYHTGRVLSDDLVDSIPLLRDMAVDCAESDADVTIPCDDALVEWIEQAHAVMDTVADDAACWSGLVDLPMEIKHCAMSCGDPIDAIKRLQFLGSPRAVKIPIAACLYAITNDASLDAIGQGQRSTSAAMDSVEARAAV